MKKFLLGIALLFVAGNLFAQEDALKVSCYTSTQLTTPTNLLNVEAGTRAYLKLSISAPSGRKYYGGQFDILMPKGVEWAKGSNGKLLNPGKIGALSTKTIWDEDNEEEVSVDPYTVSCNQPENPDGDGNLYRIVFYQGAELNNGSFFRFPEDGTEQDMLRITVTCTEDANPDICPIYVKNIILNVTPTDKTNIEKNPYIEYKVSDAGYSTLCIDDALDFSTGDLTAYTLSEVGDGYASLSEVEKVPASTPIVVEGKEGIFVLTALEGDVDAVSGNLLKGTPNGAIEADGNTFAIAKKSEGVGFYRCKAGVTIPQYKAYLENANAANDAFLFEETTGINKVDVTNAGSEVYTITGVRVNGTTQKGIYIQNGKKVVVK